MQGSGGQELPAFPARDPGQGGEGGGRGVGVRSWREDPGGEGRCRILGSHASDGVSGAPAIDFLFFIVIFRISDDNEVISSY